MEIGKRVGICLKRLPLDFAHSFDREQYIPRSIASASLCCWSSSQEEMLHAVGFSVLERGFNVFPFEGPGQPTVVRLD